MRRGRRQRPGGIGVTTPIAVVLLLLFVFLSVAWFYLAPARDADSGEDEILAELDRQQSLWVLRRPPAFEYRVLRRCDCPRTITEPYVVRVEPGRRSARFRDPLVVAGEELDEPPEPLSIDDLFARTRAELAAGRRVEVEYDARYAYPARLRFAAGAGVPALDVDVRDFRVLDEAARR